MSLIQIKLSFGYGDRYKIGFHFSTYWNRIFHKLILVFFSNIYFLNFQQNQVNVAYTSTQVFNCIPLIYVSFGVNTVLFLLVCSVVLFEIRSYFFRVTFVIFGFFKVLPYKFVCVFSMSRKKCYWGFYQDFIKSVDTFQYRGHFHINSQQPSRLGLL